MSLMKRVHDAILDNESRPFDATIKRVLERPGVVKQFAKYFLDAEFGDCGVKSPVIAPDDEVHFLNDEFRLEQETWKADKIIRIGERTIIHFEQQTRFGKLTMFNRMLYYAAAITTYYDFNIDLYQVYYHTGDHMAGKYQPVTPLESGNFAVTNRFLFVDAGSHDAWALLSSRNPYFALLGLLAREIRDEQDYIRELLSLGLRELEGRDLRVWLVDCVIMACLRGRQDEVYSSLKSDKQNMITNDPAIKALAKGGLIAEAVVRAKITDFYHRIQILKMKLRTEQLPTRFLDWVMMNASEDDIANLERVVRPGMTLDELTFEAGVEWMDDASRTAEY